MSRRFIILAVALSLLGAAAGAGFALRNAGDSAPPLVTQTLDPSPSPTPSAPPTVGPHGDGSTPETSPSPRATTSKRSTPTPSPSASSAPPPEPSYDVAAVQRQLAELGYYGGAIDGEAGPRLHSAVMAFQKIQGIGVDGVVGPNTLAALEDPVAARPQATTPSTHIEVDLGRQVLLYVADGSVARIMPVSSGNGDTYQHVSGSTATALTPVGWFEIERNIRGLREAPLGSLYDPMYFYKGWAIHGSNSVPAYPASHGCVRLNRWDALWLFDRAPVGTDVYLHGGQHTFVAGSDAPGTDTPAGDTGATTSATPSPSPTPTTSEPSPSPASSSPSPQTPSEPSPSPSPSASSSASPTSPPSSSGSSSPSPGPTPSPSGSGSPTPSPSASSGD